jgi:hypothetical protein
MLRFYVASPPNQFAIIQLGGRCPHCKTGSRFTRISEPNYELIRSNGIRAFTADYACDVCLGSIPVTWKITAWVPNSGMPYVDSPRIVVPTREEFNFDFVPETVRREIEEGLACFSVSAFNGFAALCRRAIQAICTEMGAEASAKVRHQIEEMAGLASLSDELKKLATQIMLSGHDGSHPHLPEVDSERAAVLLSLMVDLTYELYTRPGKVKKAAELRSQKVQEMKKGG